MSFLFEISPTPGGLWLLRQSTPEFRLDILSHSNRFIYGLVKDSINNFEWLGTFLYGFPHHHLQEHLWNQTSNILDTGSKPWIALGDLNELSSIIEKLSTYKGNSTRYNNINNFFNDNNLIYLGSLGNLLRG